MFTRPRFIATCAVASMPLLALAPTAGADAAEPLPIAISGQVAEAAVPVADLRAYVEPVAAYPEPGQRAPQPILLPEEMLAVDDHSYTLIADPESMPAGTIADNGLTNFKIVAFDAQDRPLGETSGTVRLTSTSDGHQTWTDPLSSTDPEAAAAAAEARSAATLSAPAAGDGVTADLTALAGTDAPLDATSGLLGDDESEAPTSEDLAADLAVDAVLTSCDWPEGAGDVVVRKRSASTTIGTGYPVGGDKSFMSHVVGSAAEYNGTFGIGSDSAGYWRQSSTKSIARGSGFTWAAKDYSRSYRVSIEYVKIAHYFDRCPPAQPYYYSWRPVHFDGGYGENSGITRPDFKNCRQIGSDGTWWRKDSTGNAYSLSYGVKFKSVVGVDFSSKRQYDEEAMLGYKMSRNRWVCGNNAAPGMAGKVMERLKDA